MNGYVIAHVIDHVRTDAISYKETICKRIKNKSLEAMIEGWKANELW